ncbi:META domain-containing protein [Pseudobacter ginsenosidimutans]|jgi:heat shock protein HslJ|uniref:Heat shock protein HslJ n=1 Tax=Pseudobacter ginsenosidimutans TaxID=661488 RepID=A0A4Q7N641_9BACT|nr:META domain-containing protein [Pseudobacter ginsenosidimutans]RZS76529.1 heat shock protein HslJ [Pseudobacter ginsenosidimutans]
MKKLSFALSGMAVTLLMAACSNSMNTTGGNHKLEGTSWKLTSLSSITGDLPKTPKEVTLQLDTGRVYGSGGCNRYFGSYSLNGSSLKFNGVASTKMFCQGAMEVEDGLMQSINNTDGYFIQGKWLSLLKGADTLAKFEASRTIPK